MLDHFLYANKRLWKVGQNLDHGSEPRRPLFSLSDHLFSPITYFISEGTDFENTHSCWPLSGTGGSVLAQ